MDNENIFNIKSFGAIGDGESNQFSNRSPEARKANAAIVGDNIKNLTLQDLTIDWPENKKDIKFNVLWGRKLKGGLLDCPQSAPYRKNLEKYKFIDSDINIR